MKKILLPTDFSANALNAIRYALRLHKDTEATFYLIHTYTPPIYHTEYVIGSPGQLGLGDILHETAMERLEALQQQLQKEDGNPKHQFKIHAAFNTLVAEVSEMVSNEGIDTVIMGTKGATGAQEILIGTNAVHVIKKAHCPVIVVPPGFEYRPPTEILFPTDFETAYNRERFASLLDMAESFDAHINVMHVLTGYELNEQQIRNRDDLERLLGARADFHEVPDNGIVTAINNFQTDHETRFLVMVQNKHTFLERLFIEPVIKKIGFHVTVPFMVIPQWP